MSVHALLPLVLVGLFSFGIAPASADGPPPGEPIAAAGKRGETWWRVDCHERDKRWDAANRRWVYYWRSAGGFENPARENVVNHGNGWVRNGPQGTRWVSQPYRLSR